MTDTIDGIQGLSLEDTILARHKKERKELLAKIQALKKSFGKDKKKKKEVLEAISKMEFELDERHSNELNAINDSSKAIDEVIQNEADEESPPVESEQNRRVSKAQKRRDKKAKEEKDKEAEILAQEEINKTGPRTMESKAIKSILKARNLMLYPILSDGDCLYNAVIHQLKITGRSVVDTAKLREITADFIHDNKEQLIFYMSNPATGDCLTDDEFEKYCEAVKRTRAWGGQIEIKALSNALKAPIEVLQATGPPTIQNDENYPGPNLVLTFHRFMYSLGEHYNSTTSLVDDGSSSDDGKVG